MVGIFIIFTTVLILLTEKIKNNEMRGAHKFTGALQLAKSSFYSVMGMDYYET
jgi:hypothetical protein